MMSARYRRVSQSESNPAEEEEKKRRAERIEKITAKLHAAVWVVSSLLILYWTDFFHIMIYDNRIHRFAFVILRKFSNLMIIFL
jgi:hypothetical protein